MLPAHAPPCVVPYFYLHAPGDQADYPSARAWGDHSRLVRRYLECVLTQVASLRLSRVACDVIFVTNALQAPAALGPEGERLIDAITAYDVEIRHADYRHQLTDAVTGYQSARYTLDVVAAVSDQARPVLITDADCVWIEPRRVFDAAKRLDGAIGALQLDYPEDWNINGFTPSAIRRLAERLGGTPPEPLRWIGGELLAGTGHDLAAMLGVCADVDARAAAQGHPMVTEEALFTLVNALETARFSDLNAVAARISTGARHHAGRIEHPLDLGLWHLPSEKGLSLRRSAVDVMGGRESRLARDLRKPTRAARRFNVGDVSQVRRLRDNAWLLQQRALAALARHL